MLSQVETANAAKVAAQQEAHELRLKMRETDGEFTSDGKRCGLRLHTQWRPCHCVQSAFVRSLYGIGDRTFCLSRAGSKQSSSIQHYIVVMDIAHIASAPKGNSGIPCAYLVGPTHPTPAAAGQQSIYDGMPSQPLCRVTAMANNVQTDQQLLNAWSCRWQGAVPLAVPQHRHRDHED